MQLRLRRANVHFQPWVQAMAIVAVMALASIVLALVWLAFVRGVLIS